MESCGYLLRKRYYAMAGIKLEVFFEEIIKDAP
jgi:hypothetical protein